MLIDKFYSTDLTVQGYGLTQTLENILYPDALKDDPFYPYYMGYIDKTEVGICQTPVSVEADDDSPGLYHCTPILSETNVSWGYCMRDVYSFARFNRTIYRWDSPAQTSFICAYGVFGMRFINSGEIYKISTNSNISINKTILFHDTLHDTFSTLTNIVFSTNFSDMRKFCDGEKTYTISVSGTDYTYDIDDYDAENYVFKKSIGTYSEIIVLWGDIQSNLQSHATSTSSPNPQIVPFYKYDLVSGNRIFCTDDFASHTRYIGVSANYELDINFPYQTVESETTIFLGNPLDFDCTYIYETYVSGIVGLKDGKIYRWTGGRYSKNGVTYRQYECWIGHNPHDVLKKFRLFNKTADFATQYSLQQTYVSGFYTPFFNAHDMPTGEYTPETYTYSQIVQNLRPWQMYGVDISENTYDDDTKPVPDAPIEGNVFDSITYTGEKNLPDFSSPRSMLGDAFTTFYALSVYDVLDIANEIGNAPNSFWQALGTASDTKYSNLIQYVVGFKWYPYRIADVTDSQVQSVQFGFSGDSSVSLTSPQGFESYKLGSAEKTYYHGTVTVGYKNGENATFLDYEPYANVCLYLPYIGQISVQARDVIGHTLTCRSVVDLACGMITFYVSNENTTLYTGSAQIGCDIMLAGNDVYTQSQKYVSAVLQSAQSASRGLVSGLTAITSKNPFLIAETASEIANTGVTDALTIAESKQGIPQTVGSGSGFGSTFCSPYPCVFVKRPAVVFPATYGKTTGYACNFAARLGTLTGFTVCQNPDLSGISETPSMMMELYSLLTSGIYL